MASLASYLQAGMELSLVVAIDFTASNGDPNDPRSLHYNSADPNVLNQYQMAIHSVGNVLLPCARPACGLVCYLRLRSLTCDAAQTIWTATCPAMATARRCPTGRWRTASR